MIEWTSFEGVFRSKPDYSLDQKQTDAIIRNRKELGGILYFDRIWTSIGLTQPQKSYPPKSNSELRSLWQKVVKAEVADEKKQALLFYVLRDCRQPNNIDTVFAQRAYLPSKYQILVAGLWELDRQQFPRALEHLADPSLTPEFADDILLTLLTTPRSDRALAMAYYVTIRPPLQKQETLQAYFSLLTETNIAEAYHFCAQVGASTHRTLFEELLQSVHEEDASAHKAKRIVTLVSLPFTREEESWFEEYLLRGLGSKLPGAKDSVIIRRLANGQSKTDPAFRSGHRGSTVHDTNWDDMRMVTGV